MVISRKLIRQAVTSALTAAVAFAVTRLGLHVNAADSAYLAGPVAWVAGVVAGYLQKEDPRLFGAPPAPAPPKAP